MANVDAKKAKSDLLMPDEEEKEGKSPGQSANVESQPEIKHPRR